MEPDWNDFKVLAALAEAGSVAGAARALGIDHSTVSRRLTALEQALGAQLLVRGGRGLDWTDEGRTALAASRNIRAAKSEIAGVVKLSCPSALAPVLTPVLAALHSAHPLLSIELIGENRTIDLAKGDADIALRMFRPSEPDLVCRHSIDIGWGLYAARSYVTVHGVPASIDALSRHRLILYVEALREVAGPRWIEDHASAHNGLMRVDNPEVAAQAIAAGTGLGVIPCFMAALHPDLIRVFSEPVVSSTGWIVYHQAARDTARVRCAVDALTAFFQSQTGLFCGDGLAD